MSVCEHLVVKLVVSLALLTYLLLRNYNSLIFGITVSVVGL
jgi:hypothetical protein